MKWNWGRLDYLFVATAAISLVNVTAHQIARLLQILTGTAGVLIRHSPAQLLRANFENTTAFKRHLNFCQ
jgi:hypothetical protein